MAGKTAIKYNFLFCKRGSMVYISHLDLMALMRRAIRRSALPFALTGGFTPRVKISIPRALKLGMTGEREEMALWLTREMAPGEIVEAVNRELPEGIRVIDGRREKDIFYDKKKREGETGERDPFRG